MSDPMLAQYGMAAAQGGSSLIGSIISGYNARQDREFTQMMQERAWAREDNAVQRRAADLEAAGLNPTLAAGSSAASSPPIQMPQVGAARTKGAEAGAQLAAGLMSMQADVARTKAQTKYLDAQAEAQEIKNKFMETLESNKAQVSDLDVSVARVVQPYRVDEWLNEYYKGQAEVNLQRARAELADVGVDIAESEREIRFVEEQIARKLGLKGAELEYVTAKAVAWIAIHDKDLLKAFSEAGIGMFSKGSMLQQIMSIGATGSNALLRMLLGVD